MTIGSGDNKDWVDRDDLPEGLRPGRNASTEHVGGVGRVPVDRNTGRPIYREHQIAHDAWKRAQRVMEDDD